MPPDPENPPAGPTALPNEAGASGRAGWVRGGRVVWLIAAAAIPQSLLAGKLVNLVMNPGGMVPGLGLLFILAIFWLAVVWGLVALAALFRRETVRLVVLTLLAVPDLWCIPVLITDALEDARYAQAHPTPDMETGVGYFDDKPDRDLVVAVRACNPELRRYGLVCDLDKVAALSRTIDVYASGLTRDSQMALALQNGPNVDVLRILLRTGKPPDDILQWVFSTAVDLRDLTLLHAALDAGLDPNGLWGSADTVLYGTEFHGWVEGVAALLDAGAQIDHTDTAGYTALMRAINERHYEVAALLLARGAAENTVASYGTTMESLVAKIPLEDRKKMPQSVVAFMDRHRPRPPVPGEEREANAAYAMVKKPLKPVTRREALPFLLPGPYPARGVILARLGFGGSGFWTVVDFDRRVIERIGTGILAAPDGSVTADVQSRVERPLSVGEANTIIEEANAIWNPPPARPASPPDVVQTDSSCQVALFDERDVAFDDGPACPAGTQHLVAVVDAIETPTPSP